MMSTHLAGLTAHWPRLAFMLCGALAVNLLLFLLMESLALSQGGQSQHLRSVSMVDFVRLKREVAPPEVKERVEPPKPEPEQQIAKPDTSMPNVAQPIVHELTAAAPQLNIPLAIAGSPVDLSAIAVTPGGGGEFREAIPLVRTEPMYPPHAVSRHIEGVVQVEFMVSDDGSVMDPVVVSANPQGVFEHATLAAIKHWKFQTKVVDGKPVPWRTRQTVRYRIADGQ